MGARALVAAPLLEHAVLLARHLYQFDGLFTCEETAEGTRVRHREAVSLRPPLAWVVEPLLRDCWLARDTAEEMARMKALLEQ